MGCFATLKMTLRRKLVMAGISETRHYGWWLFAMAEESHTLAPRQPGMQISYVHR